MGEARRWQIEALRRRWSTYRGKEGRRLIAIEKRDVVRKAAPKDEDLTSWEEESGKISG